MGVAHAAQKLRRTGRHAAGIIHEENRALLRDLIQTALNDIGRNIDGTGDAHLAEVLVGTDVDDERVLLVDELNRHFRRHHRAITATIEIRHGKGTARDDRNQNKKRVLKKKLRHFKRDCQCGVIAAKVQL